MPDELDLGPCCCCGGTRRVRHIVCLENKAPVPGTGWGCVVCHLSPDGAQAVICDWCARRCHKTLMKRLRWACRGYPGSGERIPIEDLRGTQEHDMSLHRSDD